MLKWRENLYQVISQMNDCVDILAADRICMPVEECGFD
jgi:hypothetical protein